MRPQMSDGLPLLLIGLGLLGYLVISSVSPRASLIPIPQPAPHHPSSPASPAHPDPLQDTGHPPHTFNC